MNKGPWHILLMEDSAEDCADMRQMLLSGGTRRYRFSTARLGADGVRKVLTRQDGPIDCVLLDYGLPDMNALEVLAALCDGGDLPPCPVVVITGAMIEEGQLLLSAGAQDFIGKRWTNADSLTRAVENARDRYALQVQRRHAEDALRASEERYRDLFNSIDAGYAVLDILPMAGSTAVDARFVEVNPAFARQTGLADVAGRTLLDLVPDIEHALVDTLASVARTGIPVRLEQQSTAMGRWFDLYAFRLNAPCAPQVAVLLNDTTGRKNNERALIVAKADAEAASRAKSQFLLNMSHELRSPLNSILGFTQLLESGQPQPTGPQQDSVDQILHAGWYLLGLINEILDLSSVESGRMVLAREAVSLGELFRDCAAMIEPQAQRSGIAVAFPVLAQPCLVQADPRRIKQVLVNLLTNAIKYNRPGGRVAVQCIESPGQPARIRVEDTGTGLTPAQLAQLFVPFDRLGQESGALPGTGIGLVICKRLVEQMGGRLGVESTPGVGSCFWFELGAPTASTLAAPVH